MMSLTVSAQYGDSIYLRGWDDCELHALKLTRGKDERHAAFRVSRLQR
jgi:hypothetical protein